MPVINSPPNTPVDALEARGRGVFVLAGVLDGWRNFFVSVFHICNALSQSGTTAQRPVSGLWKGRMYFDVSLGANGGRPIWVASFAAGVAVWVDSAGLVV